MIAMSNNLEFSINFFLSSFSFKFSFFLKVLNTWWIKLTSLRHGYSTYAPSALIAAALMWWSSSAVKPSSKVMHKTRFGVFKRNKFFNQVFLKKKIYKRDECPSFIYFSDIISTWCKIISSEHIYRQLFKHFGSYVWNCITPRRSDRWIYGVL